MNVFVIALRRLIAVVCAALFLVGAVWNLFCTPSSLQEGETEAVVVQPADEKDVLFTPESETEAERQQHELQAMEQQMENKVAALRMERDADWQQLYHAVAQLDTAEQQQLLQQYTQLQYKEQRLELLLTAKGLAPCLVILEEQQANVIVPAEVLQAQYEKVYDLILRNTDYAQTQIVLIPLAL